MLENQSYGLTQRELQTCQVYTYLLLYLPVVIHTCWAHTHLLAKWILVQEEVSPSN